MKTILLFLTCAILFNSNLVKAQKPFYPKPNSGYAIPFGKKLPSPSSLNVMSNGGYQIADNKNLRGSSYSGFDPATKSFKMYNPHYSSNGYPPAITLSGNSMSTQPPQQKPAPSNFHLTKDINTHSQPLSSYPVNLTYTTPETPSFAVLNNVSYFNANDGIHGPELWRSDGTTAGTYLVKDINPGEAGSGPYWIIAANGKLYFSAYTDAYGWEPWVSDGTEAGTQLLMDINSGSSPSYPGQFVKVNGLVYFTSNSDFGSVIWKTDGTTGGTSLIYDFNAADQYAGYVTEATSANGFYFFSAWTPAYGRELWRSDGTEAGTFIVKDIGPDQSDYYSPMQLTEYNNELYFSGDDGNGRTLYHTDGTADGTLPSVNNNHVLTQNDFLAYTGNTPFVILNNVLYFAGLTNEEGSGLYKYDASNSDGVVLVKDLTSGTDVDFIVPIELKKVGNDKLYFKVITNINGWHDDLWSSGGQSENTQIVKAFDPGQITTSYYDGYRTLYFRSNDEINGDELWESDGTAEGTHIAKDIYAGSGGSAPSFVTPCNGKIQFQATDALHGTELWVTDGTDIGTALVKDINAVISTNSDGSDAGFMYKGLCSIGDAVLFNAFTPALGGELYKSDGSEAGTVLLNDIWAGPNWSYPNAFLFKNKVTYFIDDNEVNTGLYTTDGTTAGLQRITYINRGIYYVVNFNVTDNGQIFYVLGNKFTGGYELWHSDGTDAGTLMLTPNLYYNDYVVTIGNTGFFVAGDWDHGFELWKSDGTLAGTKLVKDIFPGFNGSYPYSLFAYKNNLYFGAYDGIGFNYSIWKSDGTDKGTVKFQNLTPAYFYENFADPAVPVYCISNGQLYFIATDFNTYGTELWKTNGTAAGTKLVKDINPYYSSNPSDLTDVKGTLYFTADDGVHGQELWSTNGTTAGTKLVKDILSGESPSNLRNFCSAGAKLYFINGNTYPATLWSSDGTESGTNQMDDPVVNGLSDFSHLTAAGNKLFFGGYNYQYGTELYEGDASAKTLSATIVSAAKVLEEKTNTNFDASLYPNPSQGNSTLMISGSAKNVSVTIADISGKTIWNKVYNGQHTVNMPVSRMTAGVYLVTVRNNQEIKTFKFVKE